MKNIIDETTQLNEHRDQCVCRICRKRSEVKVYPEMTQSMWVCRFCQNLQVWVASATYLHTVAKN